MSAVRARVTLGLVSAGALLAATALPALAGSGSGSGATTRTVVVELAATGQGRGTAVVPSARSLTGAARRSAATSLLPTPATVAAAERDLRAAGLDVIGVNGFALTARGPSSTVDALLGADPAKASVPVAWRDDVAGVIDPAEATGAFTAHGMQNISALATAYGSGAPSTATPTLTAATPVVASLQLSGWDSGDLTRYASRVFADGSYDPVAAGQYVAVNAGRSATWTSSDGSGYGEVALDQETLLAAAPALRQRAYFAVNSSAGYLAGLQSVYNDVVNGIPIVALTTSWGACETASSSTARAATDAVLNKLTAVGVTVFAASGDAGAYDCTGRYGATIGVDFPASDPNVVGVGATTHSNAAAAPAPDTVWSESNGAGSYGGASGAGSGGGTSVAFARPSYQTNAQSGSGRAVPDLALDGDPSTGVLTISTDPSTGQTAYAVTGGTSLSAPLAAALTAVSVARHPVSGGAVGYGNILPTLYAHPEAFVDVVAFTTAYNEGDTGTVAAPGPGYDESSGLGTPRFDVLDGLLAAARGSTSVAAASPAPPAVHVTGYGRRQSNAAKATLTWSASGSLTGFRVTVTSGGTRVFDHTYGASTRSVTVTPPPGTSTATVAALSSAGSASSSRALVTPTDDRGTTARRGWAAVGDRAAYQGTLSVSSSAGRVAALRGSGRYLRITVRQGSSGGLAVVRVDGLVVRTIDTYGTKTRENVTTVLRLSRSGTHSVTITVTGRHRSASHGSSVALDAVSLA